MDVSDEEARKSLDLIQEAAQRARQWFAFAGGDIVFILWGVIWVLGYLSSHFLPRVTGWIWLVLVVGGVAASVLLMRRYAAVRSPGGWRISTFWFLLYLYVSLWVWLVLPFLKVKGAEESAAFWRHYGAIAATVPMFAYVVTGLWLENLLVWVGLGVTVLTVLGLIVLQSYFFLWMAATGGGALIGTGLFVRYRWRQPCQTSTG